jgi:hypothetical protein
MSVTLAVVGLLVLVLVAVIVRIAIRSLRLFIRSLWPHS